MKCTAWRRLSLPIVLALGALGIVLGALDGPPVLAEPLAPSNSTITYPSANAPCNTTLQACISGSPDGETIFIVPGTYVTTSLDITHPVSLVGNGADPSAVHLQPTSGRMIQYNAPSINASTVISNLTVENGDAGAFSGGGIRVLSGSGVPLFHSIVVSNSVGTGGGGIRIVPAVPVTLIGVQVVSNTSTTDGGGLSASGSITLIDSRIELNTAAGSGGGLSVGGELRLFNSVLRDNRATHGGGVKALDAVIMGGSFERNVVSATIGLGGGLLVSNTARVSATTFLTNSANNGGGVFVSGPLGLEGGALFSGNVASNNGGGVYAHGVGAANLKFISNTAGLEGGGTWANAMQATNVQYISNTAGSVGGGLYGSLMGLSHTQFIGNLARVGGGAFAIEATIVGGSFERNVASQVAGGGGLWVSNTLTLTGTEFLGNRAVGDGGGAAVPFGVATLNGARFEGNVSFNNCGGLAATTVRASNSQFVDNTAQGSGGGACGPGSFSGVRFENNRAASRQGGGLITVVGNVVISNSQFISNSAATGGGFNLGTPTFLEAHATIINTLFARNQAAKGAALALSEGAINQTLSIVHSTIADRSLNPAPAIAVLSGTLGVTDTLIVNHNIAIKNTGGTVSEDYNLYSGNGLNLSGAFFVGGHSLNGNPAFVNATADDYHLSLASAAIDAGTNAGVLVDFEGDPRPLGAGFDIGFDEFPFAVRRVFLPLVVR